MAEKMYIMADIDASFVVGGSSNDRMNSSSNRGRGIRRNHPHPVSSSLVQVEGDDMTDQKLKTERRGSSSSSVLMTLPSSMQKTQKSRRDKRDRRKATADRHAIAPRLSPGQAASNIPFKGKSCESLRIEEGQDDGTVVCSTPLTIRHRTSILPGDSGGGITSPPAFLHRGGSINIFDSGNPNLKKRVDSKTTPDRISEPLVDEMKPSPMMSSPLSLVTKISTSPYMFEKKSITLNAASSPRVLVMAAKSDAIIASAPCQERPVRGSAVLEVEVAIVPLTKKESNTSDVPLHNARTKNVVTNVKSTRSVVNRTVGIRPSVSSKVVDDYTTTAGARRSSRQTKPTDRLTITHKSSKHTTAASSMNQNDDSADVKLRFGRSAPPKKTVVITTDVVANQSPPMENIAPKRASATDKQDNSGRPIPHNNANRTQSLTNADDDNTNDEGWSTNEMRTLRNCQKDIDPTSTHYWQEVASQVASKSAMECQIKWQSLIPTPKVRKSACSNNFVVTGAASIQDDKYFMSPDRRAVSSRVYNPNARAVFDQNKGKPGVISSYDDARKLKQHLSSYPTAPYW